jgi:hypothetical protein
LATEKGVHAREHDLIVMALVRNQAAKAPFFRFENGGLPSRRKRNDFVGLSDESPIAG